MRPRFLVFFLFVLTHGLAQDLSLESVLSYSFPSELVASRNNGAIAWVENDKGVRNLYYAIAPDFQPKQLTQYTEDDGQEISNIQFSDTMEFLIYVRGGAPNRNGEIPNPTSNPIAYERAIHKIDIKTGAQQRVATGNSPLLLNDKVFYLKKGGIRMMTLNGETDTSLFNIRGSVSSLRLSPDESKLAFVNGRGDHSYIGVFDLSTKELDFLDTTIDLDSNPVWSPNGTSIAFLRQAYETPLLFIPRRETHPFSIMIANVNSGKVSRVFKAGQGQGSAFKTIAAKNQLFWTATDEIIFPWEKEGWTQLYGISANGGTPRQLTPGNQEVQYVSQSADRKRLIFNSNQGDIDRQHIWSYSDELSQLTSGNTIEWAPVIDGMGNAFCLGSSATQPADVKKITAKGLSATTNEADYPMAQLVAPQQVVMTAEDGIKVHGQLFLPKTTDTRTKKPAILFFHGGSRRQMLLGFHHRGYYHYFYAMNQYLASKGYVVLSVNYRSGIGYGMEFREALNYGAAGASEYQDVLAAAKFLQDHPEVDPYRIGVYGGSYGGYLTALGLSRDSDIFKAGVDIHGVYDWNAIIKGFIPSYNKLELPDFAKQAYDSSPVAFMEGWKSPVLLVHGDDDRNVPFHETVLKANKLRELGVEFEQLILPDEVHGFLLHRNWLTIFKATAGFFDRKL